MIVRYEDPERYGEANTTAGGCLQAEPVRLQPSRTSRIQRVNALV